MAKYSSQQLKQNWMAHFERLIIAECPELAGHIDWDTATYLFNKSESARDAAAIVIKAQKEKS